ncbi:MAG: hypothetical protein LRY40_09915, partial [Shewanella fodinae]|nr:hypothetical protein [Shewanella fodinae]
ENTANDLMKFCPIDKSKLRVVYNGVSEIYRPLSAIVPPWRVEVIYYMLVGVQVIRIFLWRLKQFL